ncbi:MAG: enoyl-CoA hydratase-related protein, partial [Acidimicrobiia bacterium]
AATVAFSAAIDGYEADPDVWVIIITGSGDKSFCAGQDLKDVASGAGKVTPERFAELGGWAGISTRTFRKPVIAAVNGAALGGGTEICLAADLVVADEHATFGLPEVKRGLFAAAGGLERLTRRIPPSIALELVLTGTAIDATRALQLGLINRVVPKGSCLDASIELAGLICENAPLAVQFSKAVVRASFSLGADELMKDEHLRELRRAAVRSEDFKEGPRAFAEKRPPNWTGR